jgi:hypothetical protein
MSFTKGKVNEFLYFEIKRQLFLTFKKEFVFLSFLNIIKKIYPEI